MKDLVTALKASAARPSLRSKEARAMVSLSEMLGGRPSSFHGVTEWGPMASSEREGNSEGEAVPAES